MQLKRIIPSAVTLVVVLCALVSILWAESRPYWACNAIIAASLLDMVDGRIARTLGAQTALGAQLDSLADITAFGMAPAILVYQWITPVHPLVLGLDSAVLASFAFVACAALRLARFNLDAGSGPSTTFTGIPSPVAALTVTTLIMTSIELEITGLRQPALVVPVIIGIAALMVAPIPFPSFKRFQRRWTMFLYFGSMLGGLTLLFLRLPGGTVLFALLFFYIGRGLVVWPFTARSR